MLLIEDFCFVYQTSQQEFHLQKIYLKALWWSVVMLRTANELAEARQHVGSANQLAKTSQYIGGRRLVMLTKKIIWIRKTSNR
jgi:hypothetical protein